MGERFALVVGIEKYTDPFCHVVLFATEDAKAMAEALEGLGVPPANMRILLNERATATALDSEVRTILNGLAKDDECFIFFAGHGFSDGFQNYLAAHDTRVRDLEQTSFRLQKLFALVKACASTRVFLFLDACHAGIKIEESMRSPVAPLDIQKEDIRAAFASCRAEENSYSAQALGHGIWTHHLLEAFTGNAPTEDPPLSWTPRLARRCARSVPWRRDKYEGSGARSPRSSRPKPCGSARSATARSRRSLWTWT